MLVLAGVSINAIIGDNGVITNAQEAKLKSTLSSYKEELEVNLVKEFDDVNNINCVGTQVKTYIPSMEDKDVEDFVVYKGNLMYIGTDDNRAKAARELGIESGNETTKDIVKVTDTLNNICNSVTPPEDDTQPTPEGCIGIRLYDKNNQNSTTWRLVIEYSNSNQEKARFGSGWFLLKKGTVLTDGTEIKNDYVVNYGSNEMILLSNYKEWTLSSQLAVTDNIALNIDATNLKNGEWRANSPTNGFDGFYVNNVYQNVKRVGDVSYDDSSRALLFNESETNTTGEGGYLEYLKNGLDFSDGFTFEYYYNTSRGGYVKNGYSGITNEVLGFFVKMPSLTSTFDNSLRFTCWNANSICVLLTVYSTGGGIWKDDRSAIYVDNDGRCRCNTGVYPIIEKNKDQYITCVYTVYDDTKENNNYDEYMRTNKRDKVEYYIDGNLYGYAYMEHTAYANGLNVWDKDDVPFFIGVAPANETANLYYLKGKVYSTRLYEKALTETEVKANYDATVQFRNSGL